MKRRKLIRHMENYDCFFHREGGRHTIYMNRAKGLKTSIPRHPEIEPALVREICKDLDIPAPSEK
jgi:mRNA interferase HicA